MKIPVICLITLALLVPAAHASPAVGTQICDPSRGACITVGPNDCVRQARYDAVFGVTTWEISQYLGIAGMPCRTDSFVPRDRPSAFGYVQSHSDGSLFGAAIDPNNGLGNLPEYCTHATDTEAKTSAAGDLPARVGTPPALYAACNADPNIPHFSRYANQPVVDADSSSTARPAAVAPAASKAVACTAVPLGKSKVAVTSIGVGCTGARNMMAAYLRRGVEPAGYVCVKARAGKVRSASCASTHRGARRVTGRWRG